MQWLIDWSAAMVYIPVSQPVATVAQDIFVNLYQVPFLYILAFSVSADN